MSSTPKQILVVEDDLDILDTFIQVLEMAGYAATGAVNGQDALDKLVTEPRPCMILLDLMMPVMTGWELHARLAADPILASIPVVFVSAAGELSGIEAPKPAAYLRKPVEVKVLLETVQRLCA
jgi:CheY-like chemotaxis protein